MVNRKEMAVFFDVSACFLRFRRPFWLPSPYLNLFRKFVSARRIKSARADMRRDLERLAKTSPHLLADIGLPQGGKGGPACIPSSHGEKRRSYLDRPKVL